MRKIIIGLFSLLILINIVYVWSGETKLGAQSIDVYAIWLFKAKVLYLNNGQISREIMENPDYKSAHWQYPLLWPVSVWQIYKIFGFNEQLILNLYPIFYGLVLVLAGINLRKTRMAWERVLVYVYVYSMMGPLLAQGGRNHAGNADILICLLGWLIVSFRSKKWLVAILVALASMIKTEGVFWAVFLWDSPWLLLAITPTIVWQIIIKRFNIPTDFGLTWHVNMFKQVWGLVRGIVREFLQFNQWYVFWPIFLLSIKKHPLWKPLLQILGGFGFVYLFTNLDSYAYVSSSFDRVLLQLSPMWMMMW